MEYSTADSEHRFVGGNADKCMLEVIGGVRRDATYINQFGIGRAANGALQIFVEDRMDRMQEFVGKLAADHRANLDYFFRSAQTIQAGHQRIMEGRRNFANS